MTVGVAGLGLIGGSFVKVYHEAGERVLAWNRTRSVLDFALLEGSADEAAKEGTALIYNKLMAYLKTQGLEVIEARGAKFDTDFHEAVTQFPAPDEAHKGMVIDVVQTGYLLKGKVLRYAKVVVGC